MVRQLCPAAMGTMGDGEIHPQPMGIHGGCRDPPTACEDPWGMQRSTHSPGGGAHAGDGEYLEEAVIQWETDPWVVGALLPGWSSLSLEDCSPWKETYITADLGGLCARGKDSCCSSFGRTAALESGLTPGKFSENCVP
ncbi:hypothetical protein TURU_157356 [Turdus rufiventris]|nr:hypothetical protein TURU_157356 [Turdus rufiventris]